MTGPRSPNLTPGQEAVFLFVKNFIFAHGMPPTRQEIADHFQWKSVNAAECYLRAIEAKGFIAIRPKKTRQIEITA